MSGAVPLSRVRKICLALPDVHEQEAWGEPTFRVRGQMFAMYENNHHGSGRVALWCKATPMQQDLLVRTQPKHCFVPPYVGAAGWVGVRVDRRTNWCLLSDIVEAACRLAAPRRLVARLEEG